MCFRAKKVHFDMIFCKNIMRENMKASLYELQLKCFQVMTMIKAQQEFSLWKIEVLQWPSQLLNLHPINMCDLRLCVPAQKIVDVAG